MGYDLHITRANDWTESEENPITSEEWCILVENDEDLTFFTENGEFFAIWKNEYAWFDWDKGEIYTKYPDELTIIKMFEIASKFSAKVQGDDGENYKLDKNGQIATEF